VPTLNWIGKDAVVNHHHTVPFHLLRDVPELSVGDPGSGNLIVEGDNLVALKALLPYYAGQVKCIYIDPPYNTGNEGWIYNDNVTSPVIREWLGKAVGKEAEDLSRHDKWLCMMYPRLELLRRLLREDGVILISIGRDELGNLKAVCDDVFGLQNLIEVLIWNTHGHTENQEEITGVHEYVLLYAKDKPRAKIRPVIDPTVPADSKIRRDFAENSITKNGPKNPPSTVELPVGFPCEQDSLDLSPMSRLDEFLNAVKSLGYISRELTKKFQAVYPIRFDRMQVSDGKLTQPCQVFSGWMSADKLRAFINNDCQPLDDDNTQLRFYLSKNGVIYYRREGRTGHYVQSVLTDLGTTETNRYMLEAMGLEFMYPKPLELISYLISLYAGEEDLILDSFAGSGTTGHAVIAQNRQNSRKQRFILVQLPIETEEQKKKNFNICAQLTAARVKCVVQGYTSTKGEKVEGLGGGFRYCTLGEPLFDARGQIRESVTFAELARHVYFTETGEPLPRERVSKSPLLGQCRGVAVYLLFNGVLGDKSANGGNVLTRATLAKLPKFDGPKVIYAAGCLLGRDRLQAERITFRQTPYEIKVS
jgi:DNA modification methylase